MNINKSKIFFPVVALIIWVILIILFGLISHFSLAGFCLIIHGLCILIYDSVNIENSKGYNSQMIASIIGFIVSFINAFNAFYLEFQGLLIKLFVALFSVACIYIFFKLYKEVLNKKQHKRNPPI